jgi:lipopolysaccharide/colanic/teichoic acid biosynthesis glycosyltransferase
MPTPVVPTASPAIRPSLARRLLDITVAVIVLGLVWPLFLALAWATRRSTGGSAIYRQLRVGEGGIPFTLFKFRSMRVDATGPFPVTTG